MIDDTELDAIARRALWAVWIAFVIGMVAGPLATWIIRHLQELWS